MGSFFDNSFKIWASFELVLATYVLMHTGEVECGISAFVFANCLLGVVP